MFNPPFGSQTPNNQQQQQMQQTPTRKVTTVAPTSDNQYPPIESLNPDSLKDLTKLQLQTYLKLHNIQPLVSKPEMKKQMRTLIHAIHNKESLPTGAPVGYQAQPIMQSPGGGGAVYNPMTGTYGFPTPPRQQFPGQTTIAPLHQQIQQQLHIQQQQQQAQQQAAIQAQLQAQLIAQQQAHQAALQAQQQMLAQQQLAAQQLLAQQQFAAQQAAQLAAQKAAAEAALQAQKEAELEAAKPKPPKKAATMADLKEAAGNAVGKSPPHSPRTKEAQSKESVGGEQCVECKSKKSNKECNNKRCRGCCIKYMLEKKSHICFLHLRDESRRPRIKDPAQTEVIVELIAQATKEQAAANGGKERSLDSLVNTPSLTSSSIGNTPLLTADQTSSLTLTLEQPDQLLLEPPSTTTTTTTTTAQPQTTTSTTAQTNITSPTQQQLQQQIQQLQQQQAQVQQQAQQAQQQQAQPDGKNDSFGRKIQSYYNNYYIGVQAQVAACSNPKRLTPYKDDRYSFFSCYKCDKVISVNGFQLWKHIQSEHTEDFFKFIKENINSRESTQQLLFNSIDSIYNNTKQKASERFNLTIEWLEELFSPIPPPEITDKKFYNERINMLLQFDSKFNQLIDSFDKNIDPVTSKYSVLETLLKDSNTFHKYYDSLSINLNNEELNNIIDQYEIEKNVNFEQRPLAITPYQPSSIDKNTSAFEFIESDSTFSLQSL